VRSSAMERAYKLFKKREAEGIAMPKERRKADETVAVGLSDVHLEGEEEDKIKICGSCAEIRRKISAHLRKPGVAQAQFLKDLASQFRTMDVKLQSKQLNDLRGKHGADSGNISRVFYAAYVFFKRLRIKDVKPKGKHRLEMEKVSRDHGFDAKHTGGGGRWSVLSSSDIAQETDICLHKGRLQERSDRDQW